MDYTNKALGLRVQTQIPLNVKEYAESEDALKNLGANNNLAFTYEKGLIVYCIEEGTRWEWKEMEVNDVGLIPSNFIYPDNIITFGIDYSNKIYNFVKVIKFESIIIPITDIVSNLTTGITKAYFTMPFNMSLTNVKSNVLIAQSSGALLTFDINMNGTSILSTKLTIDNNETSSLTATTSAIILNSNLTMDSVITFDIDQIGTVGAKGAVITLTGIKI